MNGRLFFLEKIAYVALLVGIVCLGSGCETQKLKSIGGEQTVASEPSESPFVRTKTYTGVIKHMKDGQLVIYNPSEESEEIRTIEGYTSIVSQNGVEMSPDSLQLGDVVDVFVGSDGRSLEKLAKSRDIISDFDCSGLVIDDDEKFIEVNGVRYKYGSGFNVFADNQIIELSDITKLDEFSFYGVKGKAYSLVMTKGHGYLKPDKYEKFVGGTMTIGGISILPVTDKMLIPLPEGTYDVSMKNGDIEGGRQINIQRGKEYVLDMSVFKSKEVGSGAVVFKIDPVGADLYINQQLTDYSKPVSLKYGKHSVRVVLDGYSTYSGIIDVQTANPTVNISLANKDASVQEADKKADKTSKTEKSESSNDTESRSKSSSVEKSENTTADQYDNDHSIKVETPKGATVYLDGTYMGTAPCSFPKKIGDITLTLEKSGYTTKSYSVTTIDDDKDVQWSFPDLTKE
ncbi:MAG: PEGA domain-containing protein [Eubacterium sp.]|nr:PEGA domain-containing protein [Eubacterium sp.]